MTTRVNPIPEGYHTLTPVLTVQGAARLIDFIKQVFDAKELYRLDGPNGTVMHTEVKIGDSPVLVSNSRISPLRRVDNIIRYKYSARASPT